GSSGQPEYGDVAIQSADEGTPLWRCLGPYNRVPAVPIYAGAPRSVTNSNGSGKRREPASVTWYTDAAFASVANDINRFVRIRADGKEIFDDRDNALVTATIGPSGTMLLSHSRFWKRGELIFSARYRA